MAIELLKYEPDYTVPPGATLLEALEDLGMTQVELAERTGLSSKHINQVVSGVAPLSPDTATLLEPITGIPARFWNTLEANYRVTTQRATRASPS